MEGGGSLEEHKKSLLKMTIFLYFACKTTRISTSVPSCTVYLPVVGAERCVWGIPLGAFPTHEIPLQLFHCLQCLPLTGE